MDEVFKKIFLKDSEGFKKEKKKTSKNWQISEELPSQNQGEDGDQRDDPSVQDLFALSACTDLPKKQLWD